jgi:nitroreductase/Pyruvate/2-oxoacid:ferredoxin oxidoreductase delta subunit
MQEKLIIFDDEKCTRCDICVAACPAQIIVREEGEAPHVPKASSSMCRRCGHCEVYCPAGAVSSTYSGNYPPKDASLAFIEPGTLKNHLFTRRTTRLFKDKSVDRNTVEEIMGTVRFAPSASNRQPLKWIMIEGREKVTAFSKKVTDWMAKKAEEEPDHPYAGLFGKAGLELEKGNDIISRNASNIVIAIVPKTNPLARTDSAIALTWFEILSQSFGIGTCWLGLAKMAMESDPSILGSYDVPVGYVIGDAMSFGYPKHRIYRMPKRKTPDIKWL